MNFELSRKGNGSAADTHGIWRTRTGWVWGWRRDEPASVVTWHSRSARPLLADRAAVHHSIEAQPRRRCPGAGSPARVPSNRFVSAAQAVAVSCCRPM